MTLCEFTGHWNTHHENLVTVAVLCGTLNNENKEEAEFLTL